MILLWQMPVLEPSSRGIRNFSRTVILSGAKDLLSLRPPGEQVLRFAQDYSFFTMVDLVDHSMIE